MGFKDKFYHFQHATLGTFNEVFNNYSMLKLRFFPSTTTLFQCLVKTSPVSIMHYLGQRTIYSIKELLKIGVDHCLSSFICHRFFYYAAFFPLKGKLKGIIIHFPNKIFNDIIECYQFSHQILTLLPLMFTDMTQYY